MQTKTDSTLLVSSRSQRQDDDGADDDPDSLYSVPAPKPAVLTFPKDDVPGWLRAFNAKGNSGSAGRAVPSALVLQAASAKPGAFLVLATETGAQQQLW